MVLIVNIYAKKIDGPVDPPRNSNLQSLQASTKKFINFYVFFYALHSVFT